MSENVIKLKKIAIAGAGGIGSHLTGMLFDFGVNRNQFPFTSMQIDVYDDDVVDFKNLLHQNFGEDDLHTHKVESLQNRYAINPVKRFMVEDDFKNYDLIFCGVDNMVFRKQLYEWSWKNPESKTFWIDGRCTSRQGIVMNKTVPKEKLQKLLSDSQERGSCLLKYEKENNVAHSLPIIVAGMMLQTFLNYIRDDKPLAPQHFMV